MEKTLTPEESIQIIQRSISNSRKNMREGSFYYLLWGWALILASLANYFLIRRLITLERYDDIPFPESGCIPNPIHPGSYGHGNSCIRTHGPFSSPGDRCDGIPGSSGDFQLPEWDRSITGLCSLHGTGLPCPRLYYP